MSKNTSITLGNYFDKFIKTQITDGRYRNVSEVVRAGLRLLEDEESKTIALREAIREGKSSGIVEEFDPKQNLKNLKAKHGLDG
jgi:antitoxin ParD1/3/4